MAAPTKPQPFYCRTFSSVRRHVLRPDTVPQRTLCGRSVFLADEFIGPAGTVVRAEPWRIVNLQPCVGCERSADRAGLVRPQR
jgi:hypothetical protein